MGIVGWECVYTMYIDSWSWLQWLTLGTMPMEEWFQWLGPHVDQSFLLLITVYIYIYRLVEARSIENPKRWIITCSMIRHDQFGAIEDGNMAVPWPSPAVVGDEKMCPWRLPLGVENATIGASMTSCPWRFSFGLCQCRHRQANAQMLTWWWNAAKGCSWTYPASFSDILE